MWTESGWQPADGEILSVADLVAGLRAGVERAFPAIWVEGEVRNVRVPASGHAYFSLGDDRAQIRAVCFRNTLRYLTAGLEDGLHVIARARATVYEARGELQLVVEDVLPQGEGALLLEFEARKKRLAAEGLFEPGRKRPLPAVPRAVGVVTSGTGAAVRDVLQVTARRAPGVHVVVAPARVQGAGAAAELVDALDLVAGHPEVEVVILARGGGSLEDLWEFNDEALVRAVASCPVPVITGVGHETDVTLVDFAADARAPTPSAAAELAVREWGRWAERVDVARERATRAVSGVLARAGERVGRADPGRWSPGRRIERLRVVVDRLQEQSAAAVGRRLTAVRRRVDAAAARAGTRSPNAAVAGQRARLDRCRAVLERVAADRLGSARERAAVARARLDALGPYGVLRRGYAIARTREGVVRDAGRCAPGEAVEVVLYRGRLDCRVTGVSVDGERDEAWKR